MQRLREPTPRAAPLRDVGLQWTRIGCIGFGGPPAHIALLRELCVDRRAWIAEEEFEDAIAATNLLPGPASTQLAIYCGWRVAGIPGALLGGLGFILPGLAAILALSALFLGGGAPSLVRGAGAGAGAAIAAVALQAGWGLLAPSWSRAEAARRPRFAAYVLAGVVATILVGVWVVVVLFACGALEWTTRRRAAGAAGSDRAALHAWPLLLGVVATAGGTAAALSWTALKVGALSYGGGFVIIPLMQADAVGHGWMTDGQFLNAVALGQVTPGPVVHTVASVGYAAAGVPGGLLAALLAFAPSFAFILIGAGRFDRLRGNASVRAFLDGAGPAAIGAILGSAVPLAAGLTEAWQWLILAAAVAWVTVGPRRGVVGLLLACALAGTLIAAAGGSLPPI